jgi:hypothetical protein
LSGATRREPETDDRLLRRDGNVYYVDFLPHDRAQLMCDLLVDGEVALTTPIGSPGPRSTVEAALALLDRYSSSTRKGHLL